MPRKKLSQLGKLVYALKHLQKYKDEPLPETQYKDGVWDNESKNKFADNLIEGLLQESTYKRTEGLLVSSPFCVIYLLLLLLLL
ncbi:hypothetical protein Ctaglu_46970 [Clostridium tagluense]|uniref:Uncharacterized protein n=2 Tax=Clostridium tagluense TaxID=360422 RepID=A0A401UUA0_9CLOT|nr:hypothetical protein Ctaglu_46970 [Clostridium tagluense]